MKYSHEVEQELELLTEQIEQDQLLCSYYPARWLAIQLLEGDLNLLNRKKSTPHKLLRAVKQSRERLITSLGSDLEIALPEQRYQFVQSLMSDSVTRQEDDQTSFSDKLDRLLAHRVFGLPIFLGIMYLVFNIVQNVSTPFIDWIDALFNVYFASWASQLLSLISAPAWLHSLMVEGVLAGVGGVMVFVPGLFTMYLLLSLMEQTGYIARAAFVMDRFMSKVGLHGKSFIPMVLGFGCNVPAIYATRTIEKREARLLTGLLIPFMSCSARLPVYLIFGMVFFPHNANLVIFLLYLVGIVVAAVIAMLASKLIFKGRTLSIMIMELPSYRKPYLKTTLSYAWMQSSEFIKKAGTVIVGFSIILWVLLTHPVGVSDPVDSYFGKVSSAVSPVLEPAGFGDWEASGALITGLVAKEMVVSTLAQVYHVPQEETSIRNNSFLEDLKELGVGLGESMVNAGKSLLNAFTPGIPLFHKEPSMEDKNSALSQAILAAFTPLSAAAYLIFVLLYVPCVATVSAQAQEFGWKWAMVSVLITLAVPWLLAVGVFQIGSLLGLGG
ncbi:MAG: ferrous iron transport protein B [Chloroflexota bacterium]